MRKLSLILTVLLLFQTLFSGIFTMAKAEQSDDNLNENESIELKLEEEEEKKSNQSVTPYHHEEHEGFTMRITEVLDSPNGNPYTDENPLRPDGEFWLRIEWELKNDHNYSSGEYETIQLPAEIKITEEITDGELRDELGNLVATYEINTSGLVTLTFTDYVEDNSNVSGWIELLAQLDQDKIEEEDGKVSIDPIGEEGKLEIPIDVSEIKKTLEKQGKPNKDYNANEIEWTVTFNKHALSLSDVKLEDLLPEGTEYIEGSMEVVKQSASINGTPIGDQTKLDLTPSYDDGKLTLDLGDISHVYIITYRTKVTDMDKKDFINEVTFTFNDGESLETKSPIRINRGEPLNKGVVKEYDPKTGIIEWYLEFNYDQKNLVDVTLADSWQPEGKLELVDGSVSFQKVEIDEDGKAHSIGEKLDPIGSLEKKDDGFEVSGITTEDPYYVVYQTKVKERELDGFNMKNLASFAEHESGKGRYIGQYLGAKSAGTINYAEKTIEWTIRINMDKRVMKDVIITDTLGEGLTLIDDSISMKIDGKDTKDFTLESGNPFIIKDIGDIDKELVVTYKTSYDPNELANDYKAHNTAEISWIPEGSDERIKREVKAEKEVNWQTADNSWKNASYNPETKEIEWTIIANYRENSHQDFTVVDSPQGNQKLVEDSIEVYELNIKANGNTEAVNKISVTPEISDSKFTIKLGQTDKAYKITYKTSVEGLSELEREYKNKAQIKDGDQVISDLEAKTSVYGDKKYGKKRGQQDGKQVHWSIDVNIGQELINNLSLIDTISDNQEYLEDSIKVYNASVDLNWNLTKEEEVDSSQYDLLIEDNKFTISWKEEVERPFIVEYSTLFFAGHDETVENNYEITGDGIEGVDEDSKSSSSVTIKQTASGGAVGTAGYLVIKKLDTTYGQEEKALQDIQFELIDPDTNKVLKVGETNSEGYIDFGRLLFGDYKLQEINPLEGYVIPKEFETITIEEEYIPGQDEPMDYVLEVENYVPNHNIELLKLDDEDNKLSGAQFTLYTEAGSAVETKTTDENGKITFLNLEAGKYYIEETKAPEGYELDPTRHPIEVVQDQKEPIKLELKNNPVKTSINVEKIWKGSKGESAVIELLANGTKIHEVTLNENNNWQHVFENLLVYNYDSGVTEIEYTIEEVEIEGYTSIIDGSAEEGFTVTNVRSGETEVSVEKIWKGEAADSVKINLLANGVEVDSVKLTGDSWSHTFKNLDKYDEEGEEIDYTVEEVDMDGYESTITGSHDEGYTVTNLRVGLTEVSVEKVWKGSEEEKVTINLLANDEKLDSIDLSEENDWTYTFSNLQEFDEEGQPIIYTVEEVAIKGYESRITGSHTEGFTVTNVRSGETEVSVEKIWKGEAADSVRINLLANGVKVDSVKLTEDSWSHTFKNLDKYDEEGEEIDYTVEEVDMDGYESTITGSHDEGYIVTNLRVGLTEVSVEKVWKGEAAESATIHLLANGEKIDSIELNNENKWTYEFTSLPEFDEEGQPILYTVEEQEIDGYESTITGSHEEGYTVTNLRKGFIDIKINKDWLDEEETDRPDSITVNLLQNGLFIEEYELSAASNWTKTISDLDQFDEEGQEYIYSITEHDVAGYEAHIDGYNITNLRTGEKSITITKTWLDDDSTDRPEKIEVELYRSVEDGDLELVDVYTVKEVEGWKLTIDSLPSFDKEGKAYSYEIVEVDLAGYESTIHGFDIVNLRVGEIDLAVNKVWQGPEKESITINLLANGKVVDSVELTADDNWSHVFASLAEFDEAGAAIAYSIEELEIEGYSSEITGNAEEGFLVTNTRTGITEITIDKIWENDEAVDRPESIIVDIFQNEELMTSIKISADDDWTISLVLPSYDEKGERYVYKVAEHLVEGYDSEIIETDKGYTITNTFVPKEETPKEPENGEDLPKTATNMYNYLLIGGLTTLFGAIVTVYTRRKEI